MAEEPSCFVIETDEESGSESALSLEINAVSYKNDNLCENYLAADDPLSGIAETTAKTKNNVQTSSEFAVGSSLSSSVNKAATIQRGEETVLDDIEFDFQSIDEAEKTELILKVRVHANFCMRCGVGFVQQKKLNIHLKKNECSAKSYSIETPLTCSICGEGFLRGICLRHHFMLHAQTKPFKCKECSHSFMTQRDLYSHYRTHDDCRPFICNLCPEAYKSVKELAAHRQQDHVGKRIYSCGLCANKFKNPKNLIAHKKKHTSKKPFKCKFCKQSYANNSVRNLHMRTHTKNMSGKFSFLCETCGMTHENLRWTWFNPFPYIKRSDSDFSIVSIGDSDSDISSPESDFNISIPEENPKPKTIIRSRLPSCGLEPSEDPLQFTIDLDDD